MFLASLALAARSPSRQQSFRRILVVHLVLLAGAASLVLDPDDRRLLPVLGHVLILSGIVEGAILVGWRLTQLPRSQALEFLLVSPQEPHRVFLAEALVGLGRLALVTIAGLPVLVLLVGEGVLTPLSVIPLLIIPFTWGALAGLGLAAWAYEPPLVRLWGERLLFALVLVYLIVGVLAAEHLQRWAEAVTGSSTWLLQGTEFFFRYNPFSLLRHWFEVGEVVAWERLAMVQGCAGVAWLVLLIRPAFRLLGHYHERHYSPAVYRHHRPRPRVGNHPLSWWAVKRVTQYSGRINVWLAGGFGVLYAIYTLAGSHWPSWMGKRAFTTFDQAGGIPAVATALVLLAAVPAAFQYGLWDSSIHERCRRLELLLLTRLNGRDYWDAAVAAAWKRGYGYFLVALLLWGAALGAGQVTLWQALGATAAAVLLWCLYFTLGFRAFARGAQANGLGMSLTLGVPLATGLFAHFGLTSLVVLVPTGAVYHAAAATPGLAWASGALLIGAITLVLGRQALASCEPELRQWYEDHHGRKMMT